MSENVVIQEGGVGKNLNAIKKIQTAEQGGGSVYWVPEEDITLGNKTITKNGTYKASKSGFYGFDTILVNVPGGESKTDNDGDLVDEDGNKSKVDSSGNPISPGDGGGGASGGNSVKPKPSSKDSDESGGSSYNGSSGTVGKKPDGNEYWVKTDKDGNLIETKIPSSIAVTQLPDKTSYASGETLNPSGIIVHGYYGDGGDYGTILNSELTFEPMEITGGSTQEYTNGNGLNVVKIAYDKWITPRNEYISSTILGNDDGKDVTLGGAPNAGTQLWLTKYYEYGSYHLYALRISGSSIFNLYKDVDGEWMFNGSTTDRTSTGMFNDMVWDEYITNVPISTVAPSSIDVNTMVLHPTGQPITVKWHRPVDGKELTATFDVEITSGGGGSHGF